MRHPQVVVYETDGRLGQLLRERVRSLRWALREPRQRETCLAHLRDGHPTVFVLKVGSRLEAELSLLERVLALLPDARSIVVGDLHNPTLADLAWDMGASFVLFPPMPHDWLPEIVVRLMEAVIASSKHDGELSPEAADVLPPEPSESKSKSEDRSDD